MSKFICFPQTKRWCEVSFCNAAASSSVGRKVCVHYVCIWWWRHCSLPQPSPTIMFRSGLTQWALWRLIWRWWGRRACLSSWSVHRSFYFPLKQGGVEPIERLPKAPKSREAVGEATLSDIRCNENPSVRWQMRRRGWATAVRTDSSGDVLTVAFPYVTQFITVVSSVHGLCWDQ